jgi:1-acyl-sn-glycerol-3-phosphate acyltransferase
VLRLALRTFIRILFTLLTRLDVRGLEHIPKHGPAILAANHVSIIDAPLVFMLLERSDATGLVADKYLKNSLLRWLVNRVHGIWINRESTDFRALRVAVEYLEQGGLLGIAPEGTRSRTAALSPAKTGVAFLAEKAAHSIGSPVPIVPIAISGTDRAFHALIRLRRGRVQVRVGIPFTLPALEKDGRGEALQRNTDEVMSRIASMLPESYRGAYSGHTRVMELVDSRLQS